MRDDRFFSDYGQSTLLVDGTISSLTQGSNVIAFKADSAFQVLCDLASPHPSLHTGSQITVTAEGSVAERQPSAVLLHGCVIP